jgi:hypothetical protein
MLTQLENISGKLKPCIKLIVPTRNRDSDSSRIDGDYSISDCQFGVLFLVGSPEGVHVAQNVVVNVTRLKIPKSILRLIKASGWIHKNKRLLIFKRGGDGKNRASNGR